MDPFSQQAFDKILGDIKNTPKYKRAWWWICRQAFNLRILPKRIYRAIAGTVQRSVRGYSHQDTWNLDQYLANLIANSVTHLRDTSKSYPVGMTADEWDEIQTKIILGFNLYLYGTDMLTITDDERDKMDEGMNLFVEHFRQLWS